MYDVIVIWWWASGLFFCAKTSNEYSKLILEWTNRIWSKILIAWWWRCNYTNKNAWPETYFWQNTKMLPSLFHKFWADDMIDWIKKNKLQSSIQDNGRVFPITEQSQSILDILVSQAQKNNTKIQKNEKVVDIKFEENSFKVITEDTFFKCRKLIIATGWKTLPALWTTGFAYNLADKIWIKRTKYESTALCWINTYQNFINLSGSSNISDISIFYKQKLLNKEKWNLLFTHWWLSWPPIFNTTLYISDFFSKKWYPINELQNITLKIEFSEKTKRLTKFLNWKDFLETKIKSFRWYEEAKVTYWWISLNELTSNFESKKYPWLYFLGECLDITWKTWWYSLQWCRTWAYHCATNFKI